MPVPMTAGVYSRWFIEMASGCLIEIGEGLAESLESRLMNRSEDRFIEVFDIRSRRVVINPALITRIYSVSKYW